jgi:transaldolase
MRIAISSDHAGFHLKQFLVERLSADPQYALHDLGTYSAEVPVDYPEYARAVAEAVARDEVERGIVVCGSGAGACIAAGKVPGTRAFMAGDIYTAHQAVEHDDANVLCLGERVTGPELAIEFAQAFLRAQFSDVERYRRRVGQVSASEAEQYLPLEVLRRHGQSVWLDAIARSMLSSGELRRLAWEERVVGVTSNPTIFEKAMGQGPEYEAPARALAEQGRSAEDIYWTLAIEDIQTAADILRPVYQLSSALDGYVSLECAPAVANDTPATVEMTRDLWRRLDRPNVMIKIPATPAGVPAIEESIAAGINVNVTLMFSVALYEQVARAYIRGLERFFSGRESLRLGRADTLVPAPVSVASFFVSRVDTLVDTLLGGQIAATDDPRRRERLEGLLGKAAITNARLAYQHFKEIFAGPAWEALVRRGAQVQRPLWASTSTKNPRYRDVRYVEELIGPHTVNTMPPVTLSAFRDYGRVARTVDTPEALEEARETMRALADVGIDMEAVTLQLQHEGVKLFAESFDQLLRTLEERRQALGAAGAGP